MREYKDSLQRQFSWSYENSLTLKACNLVTGALCVLCIICISSWQNTSGYKLQCSSGKFIFVTFVSLPVRVSSLTRAHGTDIKGEQKTSIVQPSLYSFGVLPVFLWNLVLVASASSIMQKILEFFTYIYGP